MQRFQHSSVLPYAYKFCLVYKCGKYLDLSKYVYSKRIFFFDSKRGAKCVQYMKIVGKLDTQFGSYPDLANNLCALLIQQIYAIKIM